MTAPGRERIDVSLVLDGTGRPRRVDIASARTVTASRVLEGRQPEDALRLVPLLFALCGTSQQVAGVSALEAAAGMSVPPADRLAREVLVTAETLAEHATRMLVDWPALLEREPAMMEARAVREAATALQATPYPDPAARGRPGGGARIDPATLAEAVTQVQAALRPALTVAADVLERLRAHPCADLDAPVGAAMPERLDPAALAERLADPDAAAFQRAPDWGGIVFETGPAARHHADASLVACGGRLAGRFQARMADTEAALARLEALAQGPEAASVAAPVVSAHAIAPGAGLATVETSRGRLVHYVEVSGDRISRYRVLAPTEWTFHPRGVLAGALAALPAGNTAATQRRAQWLVAALDPCVACTVGVTADAEREGEGIAHA